MSDPQPLLPTQPNPASGRDPSRGLDRALLDAIGPLANMLVEQIAARVVEQLPSSPPPVGVSPWMNASEAADYLRCKPKRIYDLVSQSRLRGHKDGSRLLIHVEDADGYLRGADPSLTPPRHLALAAGSQHDGRMRSPWRAISDRTSLCTQGVGSASPPWGSVPMRRASQLVSPLRLPRESRLIRPQRIAISLMLVPCRLRRRARCAGERRAE